MASQNDNLRRLSDFLHREVSGLPIKATTENQRRASRFLLRKWQERRLESSRAFQKTTTSPTDLSGACKFCSLFAVKLFGGELQGNEAHQWVEFGGEVIDLTDNVDGGEYLHDDEFWLNEDHLDALASCLDRVSRWLQEYTANGLLEEEQSP
jgi:hypothetical protein